MSKSLDKIKRELNKSGETLEVIVDRCSRKFNSGGLLPMQDAEELLKKASIYHNWYRLFNEEMALSEAETGSPAREEIWSPNDLALIQDALSITGRFEGKGYGQVTGNFDGQSLSVGILQWNYGQGSLQRMILKPYIEKFGARKLDSFFPYAAVSPTATMGPSAAASYCKRYMLEGKKVKSEWITAWRNFLESTEGKEIQLQACKPVSNKAIKEMQALGLNSKLAYLTMFDVVTQNGGMRNSIDNVTRDKAEKVKLSEIWSWMAETHYWSYGVRRKYAQQSECEKNLHLWRQRASEEGLSEEQELLLKAVYLRARISSKRWRKDVFNRKGTIVMDEGYVHGSRFFKMLD